ncbi:MAG: hypothetical protein ACJAQ6_001204 [Arenicella sp.]|jgi:hypothetical protein
MSTILDALRKSEQERKLNKLPTLTDMVAPQEASGWPLYVGFALVLLATALVILAYVIWSAKPEVIDVQSSNRKPPVAQAVDALDSIQATLAASSAAGQVEDVMLVNVVSYSADPALRFAMVNGKMIREGEFVEPGLKVEEILSDAVVFNLRGTKITRSP